VANQIDAFRLEPVRLVAVLLRSWRLVITVPAVAGVLAVGVALLLPERFESRVLLLPESRSTAALPSGIASLATQFGMSLGSEPGQSPEFYADLVQSRPVVEEVLRARYPAPGNVAGQAADSASLLNLLGVLGLDERRRLELGVARLRSQLRIDTRKTGIIELRVQARNAVLAAAVANEFVAVVNRFNTERRQSQARQTRAFVEGRVTAVERELRQAEDSLRAFYERNRQWQNSPKLTFDEGRLRRQLDMEQELAASLRRQLETSRIAEVNDVPVVTVIESAVPATHHIAPKRTYIVVGTAGFVLLLVVFGVLAREYRGEIERTDASYHELRANWRRFVEESRLGAVLPARRK